ncbi:hypothetical protein LMG29739_06068 [Paraburkholderia solisilvae]|uniref:Uncharacterized protein n=2 Tax=Paraburkholderia solisilvae TaxID=624376 RepID=A0A6J5F1K7_9BURK|nr:hypothetical protein LMG29739_06068 [Paraburkholderia solisilvae]
MHAALPMSIARVEAVQVAAGRNRDTAMTHRDESIGTVARRPDKNAPLRARGIDFAFFHHTHTENF